MAHKEEHMRVALMGATGSGKSTFINVASGSNLAVSDSLESCTIDVETSTFSLDGRTVTLIDTPGFDDTTRSDTDVLRSITDYLSGSYRSGARLAGIIYVHRITDIKMGGPSRRNFHIFRNLCGDSGLQNVLLVTNMWSKVVPDEGEARERELASKEIFFKPALDRGARMLRHDGSQASTHAILRHLVDREPSTLLIDDEMVNQGKDLAHTTAGADIMRELQERAQRHSEALEDLCLGIEAARLAEDQETREILQEEAMKAREKIEQIRGDLERMVVNFAGENSRLQNENRWYKAELRRHKTDAQEKGRLLEQERRARELATAGKRGAEAHPVTKRESRERENGEHQRREHGRPEGERRECDEQERKKKEEIQERERRERERQERERQERETKERERQERERKERQLHEALQQAKKEQERMRRELERLELKEKTSSRTCLIQ